MIYLDSASTTPIAYEVLDEMMPFLSAEYGNPNSIHSAGRAARKAVEKAREQVAASINAKPEQIIFTSGGSEANNMVIRGSKKVFAISDRAEHTSSIKSIESLKYHALMNFDIDFIKRNPFAGKTLVWKMFVNNEIGAVNPVYEIGEVCSGNNNLLFGTDCVQALGFERINVREMKCDFLTISAHKIHGPKGIGAVFVRDKDLLDPLIYGGESQEFGLRGGTENVAGIVGFGRACELAEQNRSENRERILYLRNLFLEKIDGVGYKLNCTDESKILSLQIPGIDAETLVLAMSSANVAISAGAACRNLESQVNEALKAYGLTEEESRSTVRLSFMECLSDKEVMSAAENFRVMVDVIK